MTICILYAKVANELFSHYYRAMEPKIRTKDFLLFEKLNGQSLHCAKVISLVSFIIALYSYHIPSSDVGLISAES